MSQRNLAAYIRARLKQHADARQQRDQLVELDLIRDVFFRFQLDPSDRQLFIAHARAGRPAEAADEYEAAAALCTGEAERAFLLGRRAALTG